jgi:mono/diheme cytochrome c family protein
MIGAPVSPRVARRPLPVFRPGPPRMLRLTLLLALGLGGTAFAQDPGDDPGKTVFDKWCTPCHGDGPGKPGTMVLAQRYGASRPALLEERTDLTRDYLETFVRQGVGIMPPFRKTEITDSELTAMIAYLLRH